MTVAPTIETERLTLRPHKMSDMDAFWNFYQSPRAAMVDAPKNRTHFWYGFGSEVGSWALQGFGGWAIDTKAGAFIGQVAIIEPPHFAEREIGWILFEGYEGKGYATEAARAALRFAWDTLKLTTLVSYIDRDNPRSLALAKRLGAVVDETAPHHDAEDLVLRHSPEGFR